MAAWDRFLTSSRADATLRQVIVGPPGEIGFRQSEVTASGRAARPGPLAALDQPQSIRRRSRRSVLRRTLLEKTHGVAIKRLSQWNNDPTSFYL